jgi:uncharacterized membrane protein YjjP (DUF1212 family)
MVDKYETEVLAVSAKIGRILLESGAETSRIEDTIAYIGRAAGVPVDGYVTMTAVFASLSGQPATQLAKTKLGGFNLQKVDEINQLSRQFTAHDITFEELVREVDRIDDKVIDFNWPTKIFGAGLVSVAPMLVFEAAWQDLGLAFFVGILGYVVTQWVSQQTNTPYLKEAVGGFVVALAAAGLVGIGIGRGVEHIIVSALMPLVPGVAITNSLREIMAGHMISGTVRALDALLIAGAIGAGVTAGLLLIRAMGVLL